MRAGAVLIVAVLALAGCKSTDPKPGDDKSSGGTVGRAKDTSPPKGQTWLQDMASWPGAGTDIPKGTGIPPSDPKTAAQQRISGLVLDPDDRPARNIMVRVEENGRVYPPGLEPAIYTSPEGYFETFGIPGKSYQLTAITTMDGRKLAGILTTTAPKSNITIKLREDLAAGVAFPPAPKPSDKVGDGTAPLTPKASPDVGWGPGGPGGRVPPPTLGGTGGPVSPIPPASGGQLPPPDPSMFQTSPSPTPKPENVANTPNGSTWPPPASIPGQGGTAPPVPPLPVLPPSFNPPGGGRSSMIPLAPNQFVLSDTFDPPRPWSLDLEKPGELVLVEFIETTSPPCKEFLPVLTDLQSRYGVSGLQVVGVSCDVKPQRERAALVAKFAQDNNLNYAVYVEPGEAGSVRNYYRVERYPHVVLLDSTGKVLWTGHPGYREALEAVIKQNLGK